MIGVIGIIGIVALFAGVVWLLTPTPRDEAPGPRYPLPSPPSRNHRATFKPAPSNARVVAAPVAAASAPSTCDSAVLFLLLSDTSTPEVAPPSTSTYESVPVDDGSSHSYDHGLSSHDHGSSYDSGGGFDGGSSGGFD